MKSAVATSLHLPLARPVSVGRTLLLVAACLLCTVPAYTFDGSPLEPAGRPGDRRPELLDEKLPQTSPAVTLPLPPPVPGPAGRLLQGVFVRQIEVTGSSLFSAADFAAVTTAYENRVLTVEDLEALRRELTRFYVSRGYVNSGAVLPDQMVQEGRLELRIVEGELTEIEIGGDHGFRESYLRRRIALAARAPLNLAPLQEQLQLLQLDPRIEQVRAELSPGSSPGQGRLKLDVQDNPPFSAALTVNNHQSPSIGAERGLLTLAHQNLTGHGDVLSFSSGYSEGLNTLIDAWYALPFTVYDTSLLLRYRKNDFVVIDEVFRPLDIVSRSESFEIGLRQPIYRSLTQEFSLSLSLEWEKNFTTLGGIPFSFSAGVNDGKTVVTPLRFSQDWTYRTQQQVISARSRFTFGLDALGATIHDDKDLPDADFVAWLGQLQWARVLDFQQIQLLARLDLQRTSDPLLPIEQIPVGGRYSVRGYRENQLVRDEALIASLESRIPLVQNSPWAASLQICPFFDYGRGTNQGAATPGPKEISSAGVGLRWSLIPIKQPFILRADSEFYWGYPLRDIKPPKRDLQDDGIHFQFVLTGYF